MTTDLAADGAATQYFTFLGLHLDIDRALALIAADKDRPTQPLDVRQAARLLSLAKSSADYLAEGKIPILRGHVDEEYARTADLSVPVIMADLASKGDPALMLIDGTHRLRRAYVDGLESLPAYVLDRAEVRAIRVP